MALNEALKKLKFDTRLTEWYLKNNLMTQDELKAHLGQLPDVGNNIDLSTDDDIEPADTPEENH
jgi:hypothetical protein